MDEAAIEVIKNDVFQKIHDIEDMLLKADPMLPGHLQAIHTNLKKYEELSHLLSDDQIRQLIRGQSQVTGSVIATAIAKSSKASNTRAAKGITAADL